jgi:hypothetical protein
MTVSLQIVTFPSTNLADDEMPIIRPILSPRACS